MTEPDLLLLARIVAEARGVKLGTVSRWATRDTNPMLFDRLAQGRGCTPRTCERAAAWFRQHWPRHVAWPRGVPRQEPAEARLARRVLR